MNPLNQDEQTARYDRDADPHGFTVFMREGGWCWYQDPRVIVHQGKLLMGAIQGNEGGDALAGIYDLEARVSLGSVVLHPQFGQDDHNSPVFHIRPDGAVLAVYAKHGGDLFHYSRVSDPNDLFQWSEELRHERPTGNSRHRVTYMNLYELSDEGQLYNFYRGINYNPSFVTSGDSGETWSQPQHFVSSEIEGPHRPYARYLGNGKDTIHVTVTNSHPRRFGNSIYYFKFREGNFYNAAGTYIKNLAADGPLFPIEAELVYQGSHSLELPKGKDSVPGAAWTSSIALDQQGHPHIAYSLHLDDTDHRFRLASWDGERWDDREVAYAGHCLYARESSYTGLITVDPVDPEIVFISTDVNPSTGEDTGGRHEIYRAKVSAGETVDSICWAPVTKNSPVRNIRPVILHHEGQRIVLWNRGDFKTFKNYQLDTVGFIEGVRS